MELNTSLDLPKLLQDLKFRRSLISESEGLRLGGLVPAAVESVGQQTPTSLPFGRTQLSRAKLKFGAHETKVLHELEDPLHDWAACLLCKN